MVHKSNEVLREIFSSSDYTLDARKAAEWELERRKELEPIQDESGHTLFPLPGEGMYAEVIASFKPKRNRSFFGMPKHSESLHLDIPEEKARTIIRQVVDKLEWKILSIDKEVIQIGRINERDQMTELLLMGFGDKQLFIESRSLSGGQIDNGRNHLRILLFLYVFKEIKDSFDK